MDKRRMTREAYTERVERVETVGKGDTSFTGRQRIKETGKLHPLVDPSSFDLIRRSWPRYDESNPEELVLPMGIPMLVENEFDTTGSMHGNIKLAFDSLPRQYDLLANGENPVLGRYDTQIINAIFGDIVDKFVLARSQAEMDVQIAEQLMLMVPEGAGDDDAEDPEYGLFGAAYLTDAFITRYGLKSYHFMTTDAPSHGRIDHENLVKVFGEKVFERVRDNGHQLLKALPDTGTIVRDLKKRSHAFAILVGSPTQFQYWAKYYGDECVVNIRSTAFLPEVEAAIIGLTEGVLDLQSLPEYLKGAGCNTSEAREIQRAVSDIPIGAQTVFPNFAKIPPKGSVFAKKHDLWPMDKAPTKKPEKPATWL